MGKAIPAVSPESQALVVDGGSSRRSSGRSSGSKKSSRQSSFIDTGGSTVEQPAQSSPTNTDNQSNNVEEVFNKMLQTQMGRNLAPAYLNNQYKSGKITEEQVRKLAGKL